MPEKTGSRISLRYRIEWLAVVFFFWFFKLLGQKRASSFGSWIARKIGPYLKADKTARKNLSKAFPDWSPEKREEVLDRMWSNLGRNAAELPFIKDMDFQDPDVELVGGDYLDAYVKAPQAAFFLTGHYGPWELTIAAGKYCKVPLSIIYRAANNPLVDAYFQQERFSRDYSFIPKGTAGARGILKAIKKGEAIALLNDQKQNTGLPIPFFGRDAMTAPPIAELACKFDLPIYPIRAERLDGGKKRVTVSAPIFPPSSGNREKDVVALLTTINELYEQWITEKPDHWFWVHNRWPE
ncbi:lysophospholipid acyltransferase family protein [Sneathiella aquimaris]|uniref:lysophospholipid acyltransferase family protein n=1 Tax=Sneathiella aquimaris TaxID=2599305 RepID=UPI00146C1091|nr:lysophospholipid acyltransferase family protein [Sneathiella aquimaris]